MSLSLLLCLPHLNIRPSMLKMEREVARKILKYIFRRAFFFVACILVGILVWYSRCVYLRRRLTQEQSNM